MYRSGESFQSSCKYQCTCLDGAVGCVPLCSMDVRLPSPDCPFPRRVKLPGKCCEEWVCDEPKDHTVVGPALAGESFSKLVLSFSPGLSPDNAKKRGKLSYPGVLPCVCVLYFHSLPSGRHLWPRPNSDASQLPGPDHRVERLFQDLWDGHLHSRYQ